MAVLIEETNAFREKNGRSAVRVNPKLTETANYFARFMAKTDKYGHHADGNRPSGRAKKHGYDYCVITENIAYQYDSRGFETRELADKFFVGWKESPGHRKNMLDPDVTETGVAIAKGAETEHYYAVQMFGRPQSQSFKYEIHNDSESTIAYKVGDRSLKLPPRYIFRTHQACRKQEIRFHLNERKPSPAS